MSRLTLQDCRRLKFTIPALLDAALTFDREHNGWMWRASGHSLVIDAGGGGAVTIEARRSAAAAAETVNRSPAWVAAALLQYCFKRRIPIPRNGTKTIEVLPDGLGVAMLVEVTMVWPALELSPEAVGAAEKPRVQVGAPPPSPPVAPDVPPATAAAPVSAADTAPVADAAAVAATA